MLESPSTAFGPVKEVPGSTPLTFTSGELSAKFEVLVTILLSVLISVSRTPSPSLGAGVAFSLQVFFLSVILTARA